MINFKLKHIDQVDPAGTEDNLSMSWFWLTDGDLWLNFADSILYEYSTEALAYFESKESPSRLPFVRFIEDFTELFELIAESVPEDLYKLTENLPLFIENAQQWLDINDSEDDDDNEFYFEEYDNLISWTYKRTFDSGHLIGGPKFSFFRSQDNIRIIWETEHKLENGIDLWTAKNGSLEISYDAFIQHVEDFGKRFFKKMKEQVELVVNKDWKNIQLDKKYLIEEHAERESDFWKQCSKLNTNSSKSTPWLQIHDLHTRMSAELKKENQIMKPDKGILIIKVFLIFGFLFFAGIAYYLSDGLIVDGYIQVTGLVMVLFFLGFGVFCLLPLFNFEKHIKQYMDSRTTTNSTAKTPKWLKVLGLVFCIPFLFGINYTHLKNYLSDQSFSQEDMVFIDGTLSQDVEYLSPSRGSHSLYLKTVEYPKFRFDIRFADDFAYIKNNLSKGSKIQLLITRDDHQVWIQESKEKSFWDKHENNGSIAVFGIQDSEYIYFDLNHYNTSLQQENESGFYTAIVIDAIALILLLTYLYRRRKLK